MKPVCVGCGKHPADLREYVESAKDFNLTPDQYVTKHEGTYNPENGHFLCTPCYVNAGTPSAPGSGWRAP